MNPAPAYRRLLRSAPEPSAVVTGYEPAASVEPAAPFICRAAAADQVVATNPERQLAQTARRPLPDGIDLAELIREEGT